MFPAEYHTILETIFQTFNVYFNMAVNHKLNIQFEKERDNPHNSSYPIYRLKLSWNEGELTKKSLREFSERLENDYKKKN
jgi:hypothetical protein